MKRKINKNIVLVGLIGLISCVLPMQSNAQITFDPEDNFYEITTEWDNYYDSLSIVQGPENMEGTGYKHYMNWKSEWEPKVYPTGDFLPYLQALENSYECFSSLGYYDMNGLWEEVGPTTDSDPDSNTDGVGRLATIAIDPLDDSIILVGSPVGGLYYTENYGAQWINAGLDNPKEDYDFDMFTPGIASIVILHDADTTWWYIATGDKDDSFNYSRGVLRSNDKGATWQQVNNGLDIGVWNFIRKIIVDPDNPNYIFAATSKGIYRTQNALASIPGLVTWEKVLEDPTGTVTNKNGFFDIEFSHHQNGRKIIATMEYMYNSNGSESYENTGDGSEIWWTSDPEGDLNTWNEMPNSSQFLPTTGEFKWFKIMLETTPADPDVMYAYVLSRFPGTYHKIYKYSFVSGNWTFLYSTSANAGRTAFTVSPVDADILYYGFIKPYYSDDGGYSWAVHFHSSGGKKYPHSDIHEIKFNSDGSSVWAATDGGPFVSETGSTNNWENKVNDIGIAIVHYFDQSKIDPAYYLFGGYDVHSQLKKPGYDYWFDIGGGDGYGCAFDNEELGTFYASNSYRIYRYIDWQYDAELNPPGGNFWTRHVTINPVDHNTIYTSNGDAIYRSLNQGSSWQKIADNSITDPPVDQVFYDMHVAEGNGDYLYLRVVNADGKHARIYKTINVNETNPNDIEWELITPYPGMESWLGDIEVDSENPDKIWACYSNTSGDKIYKYENSIWTAITNNLADCYTGIYSLAHLNGTDNGLFASGYHGIFYLEDGSNEWKLFKPGQPTVGKINLEINYCSGKIVSGTKGRGIWETDLPTGWDDAPVLTSNETWDGYRVILNPVHIPSGVTLSLKGTVAFTANGKIIVEKGGHLVLDGAYLTNICSDMWYGIEVWGNPAAGQNPIDQGWVLVKNGAIIENSVHGIVAGHLEEFPTGGAGELMPNPAYAGGIVQASHSFFTNNQSSVQMYDYKYTSSSWFVGCKFEVDDAYIGGGEPENFMRMNNMKSVNVTSCDFANSTSTAYKYTGLLSENSTVYLKGTCLGGQPCTEWDPCVFHNLEYGVYATANKTTRFVDVEHTDFDENFRGMYISGMSNARVVSNNFKTKAPYVADGGYGLYLDRSTAYKVEENNFYHTPYAMLGLGLVVNNSGGGPNQVYRNYFSYLECGMDIQGENRDQNGIGLELKCNQYEGTMMDKIITWDSPLINPRSGIASSQGAPTSSPEDMAGNLFYIPSPTPNGDYDDILNEGNHITYYYPLNAPGFADRVKPVDYTQNTVSLVDVEVDPAWSFNNGCPPSEEPGGGGIGDTKGKMASAGQKADSTENILALLIDGGNTEAVQADVDNSVPPETMQVYNDLMGKSPYLSDTVIKNAINKENVLPRELLTDVLVANPQVAKSDVMLTEIENRSIPLTDDMKEEIMLNWYIAGAKESLESKLLAYKAERGNALNKLIRYFRADTLSSSSADSIIALLQNENALWAKYILAHEYLAQGETLLAENVMGAIPVGFDLSQSEQEAHLAQLAYFNVLKQLKQGGNNWHQLDSLQMEVLYGLAYGEYGKANTFARNVLMFYDTLSYKEVVQYPSFMKSGSVIPIPAQRKAERNSLNVYPNPARDYFIIRYELDNSYAEAVMDITDISGRNVKHLNITMLRDYIVVPTMGLNNGLYVVKLVLNGHEVGTQKVNVSK